MTSLFLFGRTARSLRAAFPALLLAWTFPSASSARQPVQPESLTQGFVLVVQDKSGVSNASSPIYLASNHNGWNPNDPSQKLTARSDGKWQIVLPKPRLDSRMAFKFTRGGSWETVEVDADGNDIENRLLPLLDPASIRPGEPPVIELTVEKFKDQTPQSPAALALDPYRPIAVAGGTLRRLEVVGGGGIIAADPLALLPPNRKPGDPVALTRDVLVWLPPGYDAPENADRRYPVLYLQDGQNVFEQLPGVPGEWRADETGARLIEEGRIEPLIIAAIPHAGQFRVQEYVPIPLFDGVPAHGEAYVTFLVTQVVPRVERAFRVKTGPEHTAIGGASLGGLISLYAATQHPDIFGKVLVESTPLTLNNGVMMRHFRDQSRWPRMVYFGMGGKEAGTDPADSTLNDQYAQSARDFEAILREKHAGGAGVHRVVIADGAVHNEPAWAERLAAALEFLFPVEAGGDR